MTARILPRMSVALLLAGAAACGGDERVPGATQVAAQVNADEITVHQVNAALARTQGAAPQSAEQAKRQALERLIDRQLAVQQALRRKLDRSPDVVQAMEAARAEVLARAFADAIARTQPEPTQEEAAKYYAEHPELFAERRVYVLEEVNIDGDAGALDALRARVARARSVKEVTDWLAASGMKYSETRGVRTAEQVPLDLLPRLHAMKEGDIRLFEAASGAVRVLRVVAAKAAPVDASAAAPRIQQFLFNTRATEALAKEMRQVKAAAKVSYLGEFAESGATTAGRVDR